MPKEQLKFHWCAWELCAVEVRAASIIIIGSGENNQETFELCCTIQRYCRIQQMLLFLVQNRTLDFLSSL